MFPHFRIATIDAGAWLRSHSRAYLWMVLLVMSLLGGCRTTKPVARPADATAIELLEPWAQSANLVFDGKLEEVASLLCSRDTDAVIDNDVRRATQLVDAQVAAVMGRAKTLEGAQAELLDLAPGVLEPVFATHLGVVFGKTPEGQHCMAAVVSRRHADLLPSSLAQTEGRVVFAADLHPGRSQPVLFVARPDGSVARMPLESYSTSTAGNTEGPQRVEQGVSLDRGDGAYVFELVVNVGPEEPEIALLWTITSGSKPRSPPAVDVLFPDAGHPDRALTRRLEALVSRLRTTQLLDTMKISPSLSRLAASRARALATVGVLGHKVPSGQSAYEDLRTRAPKFGVARLGEVQAQAGSLDEAWRALLRSPAHRYELVEPWNTHMGAAVKRAPDQAGRELISLIVIVAKRTSQRKRAELATELVGRFNLARHREGARALKKSSALDALAIEHAKLMAASGTLDDNTVTSDGKQMPIAAYAHEKLGKYDDVRAVFARLSDPLRLSPSKATLNPDAQDVGVGLWPQGVDGQWYVCILIAER